MELRGSDGGGRVLLEGEDSVLGCDRPGDCGAVGLDPVDGFSVHGKKNSIFVGVFARC